MVAHSSLLTTLLPSTSYTLVYVIPLLLFSLLLTFAGAFLTLDRTRSFPSDYDAVSSPFKKNKFNWRLQGGVGGLAAGWVFGIHFATFLALLIPAISTSSALTPKSFLPVWFLPASIAAFLGGRWKYCALAFSGISGGTLIALSLSVIMHPSLISRIILTAIIMPILTIMALLPLIRYQHAALRFAMSGTGAFGIILSIALLSHIPAWANVWERYWERDDFTWGTSKEKGLSAAFCLFLIIGMACDWFLRHMFGECPDEKWDHYLAKYTANIPNRAGTFRPLHSFWDHLFKAQTTTPESKDIIFPRDEDIKIGATVNSPKYGPYLTSPAADIAAAHDSAAYSKRGPQFQPRRGRREVVKFNCVYNSDSDEDYDDRLWSKKPSLTPKGSQRTLNGGDDIVYEKEKDRLTQIRNDLGEGEVPEYSDFEEDVTDDKNHSSRDRDSLGRDWSPGFLRKHRDASVTTSSGTAVSFPPMSPVLPPIGAVPVTPSLLKALDRVAAAQQAAFMSETRRPGLWPSTEPRLRNTDGLPNMGHGEEYKGPQWDEFWRDVGYKTGH